MQTLSSAVDVPLCVCELCAVERSGIFPISLSLVFRHQHFNCVYVFVYVCARAPLSLHNMCGREFECETEEHFGARASVCAEATMLVNVCLCMCAFIHVRMSTREHWGAFRQHKAYSYAV